MQIKHVRSPGQRSEVGVKVGNAVGFANFRYRIEELEILHEKPKNSLTCGAFEQLHVLWVFVHGFQGHDVQVHPVHGV